MQRPVGFIGASGAGKTTLLVKLIRHYRRKGISTGVIKHGHHPPDAESGDTQRCLEAGAVQAIYAAGDRFWRFGRSGLTDEGRFGSPEDLPELMSADRLLIEGFKHQGSWPRILVERQGVARVAVPIFQLAGIVTDEPAVSQLPAFGHEAIESIAEFVDRISTK